MNLQGLVRHTCPLVRLQTLHLKSWWKLQQKKETNDAIQKIYFNEHVVWKCWATGRCVYFMAHSQTRLQDIYFFVHFGGSVGSVNKIFYVLCQNIQIRAIQLTYTWRPCFTPIFFMPSCFNAPYQFTPLPNLQPLNFSLTPFGCFISISVSVYFHMSIKFLIYTFLIYGHVFRNTTTV